MSAVQQILAAVLGRVIANKVTGAGRLKGLEPGRYPQPEYGPIVVPKGAEIASIAQELRRASERNLDLAEQIERLATGNGEASTRPANQLKLTPWAIYAGFAALVWYAWRASESHLAGDEELFPGLRRELHMDPEDPATSHDPIEACLERRGWDLKRMRVLRDSIAAKATPDMFSEEEDELTGPEAQLLEQIEDCLDRIEKEYGSLEAAGLEMIPCGDCSETDADAESSPQ